MSLDGCLALALAQFCTLLVCGIFISVVAASDYSYLKTLMKLLVKVQSHANFKIDILLVTFGGELNNHQFEIR